MSDTGAIIFVVVVIIFLPILAWALAGWARLIISFWIVMLRRLIGHSDTSKDFFDEVGDTAFAKTDYAKMKREFDEQKKRVRASIDKGRERML